jgi:hypothetical protein
MILVSHVGEIVKAYCSRAPVLHRGRDKFSRISIWLLTSITAREKCACALGSEMSPSAGEIRSGALEITKDRVPRIHHWAQRQ